MPSLVPLAGNKNVYCGLKAISNGNPYLDCTVKGSSTSSYQSPPISGSRPPMCEIPGAIHEYPGDGNLSPLGDCAYRYSGMSRCGCPILDPKKNPHLWNKYVTSVTNIVLQRVQAEPNEITLTFFASGYLLQDCELLGRIFDLPELQNWEGRLNLQFVDLEYEVDKVQSLKSQVSTFETGSEMNMGLVLTAIACGGVGAGAIYAGTKQEKKEYKYSCMGGGAILIFAALILSIQAASSDEEEQGLQDSHSVTQIKMEKPKAEAAIQGFLNQIAARLPRGISMQTSFFPSAEACVEQGSTSDAVLGYDIGNALTDFDQLRARKLKEQGNAIVVIKTANRDGEHVPVFLAARDPRSDLQPQRF